MRLLITALLAIAVLPSCKAASDLPKTSAVNADSSQYPPGHPLSARDKDGTAKSAFDNETVLRLNAIVRRSRDLIDEFDKTVPEIRAAVTAAKGAAAGSVQMQKAQAGLAKLGQMYEVAKTDKNELAAEGDALSKSGKYYDVVIFSGMGTFVTKVEAELSDEIKDLNAKLK